MLIIKYKIKNKRYVNRAGKGPAILSVKKPIKFNIIAIQSILIVTNFLPMPMLKSIWWICLLSGLNGFFFLNNLLIITLIISNEGKVTHHKANTGCMI